MIYIVHGEDFSRSRELVLNQQKKLGIESKKEINIADTSPQELFDLVHSTDLFGGSTFTVLNVSKAGRMNLEPFVESFEKLPEKSIVVILSDKVLSSANAFIKSALKLKAKVALNIKIPQGNAFRLGDALFNKQREKAYLELSKLMSEGVDPFEIFSALIYGLRSVTHAKFNSPSFAKAKDFIKQKTQAQQKNFTEKQLVDFYNFFRETDRDAKIGNLDLDLMVPLAIEKVLNS